MDEVDSAATWDFIHQQQSLWSTDDDNPTSDNSSTFPMPSIYSQTSLTSLDSAFVPRTEFSNFPSPSTTLTSSGSSFLSDGSDYRTNSTSITSQDSGFDETDAGYGYSSRRHIDQDLSHSALGRSYIHDISGSGFFDDLSNSGETNVYNMYESSDFSLDNCHIMKPEELAFLLKAGLEKVSIFCIFEIVKKI